MTNENLINTQSSEAIENDNSGLLEMQNALDEIEKLEKQEKQEKQEHVEEEVASDSKEETDEVKDSEDEDQVSKNILENSKIPEKKEDKAWKLKKDKYRLLAEKEALAQENLQLKQMLDESLKSGTYHYGKSTFSDLERAKEEKRKAIEIGDTEALINADIEINRALNTISELERWKTNDESKDSFPSSNSNEAQQYNQVQHEIAKDWLENHSYLVADSDDYNPDLSKKVYSFINKLDSDLARNNQTNAYFSEKYFKTIEKFIDSQINTKQPTRKSVASDYHVGAVRNTYSGLPNSPSKTPEDLTPDEKVLAQNLGVPENIFLKYKKEELKKGKK